MRFATAPPLPLRTARIARRGSSRRTNTPVKRIAHQDTHRTHSSTSPLCERDAGAHFSGAIGAERSQIVVYLTKATTSQSTIFAEGRGQ